MINDRLIEAGMTNAALLDELYQAYRTNPSLVDPAWHPYFEELAQDDDSEPTPVAPREPEPNRPMMIDLQESRGTVGDDAKTVYVSTDADQKVYELLEAYRIYGHIRADVNPIRTHELEHPAPLRLESHGFHPGDEGRMFTSYGLTAEEQAPLQDIVAALNRTYCGTVGIEYMGCHSTQLERWIQDRIEPTHFAHALSIDQRRTILEYLNKSELFESFLHTKYVGQKRFSLEGGETLIPILAFVLETGAETGIEELVVGMAHRGRLNVLVNILNKGYAEVFNEFDESYIPGSFEGSGDVKYHKGFKSTHTTSSGKAVQITLASNPSHLEAVNPVVTGQARAKQVQRGGEIDSLKQVMPVLIHGDAAVAGQGVVYETLQMNGLPGYGTGGTLHIVVNNQIGFTTLPKDARSTRYCTDIAQTFGAPVFHVNAEDPEGCITATILAVELRQRFGCDVWIELNCYRKYGHNEGDEPAFTQPLEYQLIRSKKPIREIYRDFLVEQGVLEKYMAEGLEEEFRKALQKALKGTKSFGQEEGAPQEEDKQERSKKEPAELFSQVPTKVPVETLQAIAKRACTIPEGFTPHRKLQRLLKDRLDMAAGEKPVDWGMAEVLAYASLVWEGRHVRLSGQDARRGTFSHRHVMWVDQKNAHKYFSLSQLKEGQGRWDVFNSHLSEYGVLGFEFGYSLAYEDSLVLWEAQFGDFANGAQIIIDQFIATAEQKWGIRQNLTLLLPHGFEGQGPEHSSGRIERFMGLAGNYNMQIVDVTTPAQLFHLLRRQALQERKRPLVVFTPKGLLRHPECVSDIEELGKGRFHEILDDPSAPSKTKRLIFCTGRIYYDLIAGRARNKIEDLAIIRIEQLYPLHMTLLQEIVNRYPNIEQAHWVQEEPSNMGGWKFMRPALDEVLPGNMKVKYVGRPPSAAPATGSFAIHKREQTELLNAALTAEEQPFYEMSYEQQVRA